MGNPNPRKGVSELMGSVTLFQERDHNRKSERHPNWKGEGEVQGVKVRVAGWDGIAKNGNPYITVKIEIPGLFEMPRSAKVKKAEKVEVEIKGPKPFADLPPF